jgi:outer membrane protein OmpA-like peptidoglycan-associated protein
VEKFNKIYFAFDKYELTNKAKFYLNSIVAALNAVPEAQIMIDGHASAEGEDAYNDILSENRARAVANYLVSRGVDRKRIVTAGHGSRMPNEDMEREEMRRDRRVEVKVVYNDNVVIEK